MPMAWKSDNARREYARKYYKEYNKRRYHDPKHHERIREGIRKSRATGQQRAREIVDEYRKAGCLLCSENEPYCLVFHHLDPAIKDKPISAAINRTWSRNRILAEIEKCVCLCANCHRKVLAGVVELLGATWLGKASNTNDNTTVSE